MRDVPTEVIVLVPKRFYSHMERIRKGTEESHVRGLERNREAVGRKKEQGRRGDTHRAQTKR